MLIFVLINDVYIILMKVKAAKYFVLNLLQISSSHVGKPFGRVEKLAKVGKVSKNQRLRLHHIERSCVVR